MFMFGIDLSEMSDSCDWCDEKATAAIFSALPMQHACEEHLADWLMGQANAIAGEDYMKEAVKLYA